MGSVDSAAQATPLRRWTPTIIAVVVVLGGLGAFAVARSSGASGSGSVHQLGGEVYLFDPDYTDNEVGWNCVGRGDMTHVTTGAPIQVKDQKGTIVGSGSVEQGKIITWREFMASTDAAEYDGPMEAPAACKFKLSVGSVADADLFSVEVGGKVLVTKTRAELASSNWNLNFMDGWTLRKPKK